MKKFCKLVLMGLLYSCKYVLMVVLSFCSIMIVPVFYSVILGLIYTKFIEPQYPYPESLPEFIILAGFPLTFCTVRSMQAIGHLIDAIEYQEENNVKFSEAWYETRGDIQDPYGEL